MSLYTVETCWHEWGKAPASDNVEADSHLRAATIIHHMRPLHERGAVKFYQVTNARSVTDIWRRIDKADINPALLLPKKEAE